MRTALISGGTGGLGSAVTLRLLAGGWRCVLPYAQPTEAERLREQVDADSRDRLSLVAADLFDERQVTDVAQQADVTSAPVAAVVNLIGGFDAPGPVHETSIASFEKQLQINLRATYLLSAAALPGMLEREDGAIICISSRAAVRPFPGASGYVTSKAALLAFVDAMASEYTSSGIRVNAVLPSVIDTPANRSSQPDADYSQWVKPSEIAQVIDFLCSQGAAPISGAHIPVYGRA